MKTKGILLTILSAVLFGFNPLLSKQIYALGGNSVTVIFFQNADNGAGLLDP